MADLRISLRELVLKDAIDTGKILGQGAFGVVNEFIYKGIRCAGKMLHAIFQEATSEEKQAICDRFEMECLQLSKLRHPNIVLFLGVHFKKGADLPALLMEYLPTSLYACLERYPNLQQFAKDTVLLDVANGLCYLHSHTPPLVHRDLTAMNVLLSESMRGKIADLGTARIINPSQNPLETDLKLTEVPGHLHYMPPETFGTFGTPTIYNHKLDIFSYGILILHTVIHKFPIAQIDRFESDGREESFRAVPEVRRREPHIAKMEDGNPLKDVVLRCLNNLPKDRPNACDLVECLEAICKDNPSPYQNVIDILSEVQEKSERNASALTEIHHLKQQVTHLEQDSRSEREQKEALILRVTACENEIREQKTQITNSREEIEVNRKTIASKDGMLEAKERRFQALEMEFTALKMSHKQEVSLLHPNVSLVWNQCADLPLPRKHAQIVLFEDKIVVGSGFTDNEVADRTLYTHCTDFNTAVDDVWDVGVIPNAETRWFAMIVFNGFLTLIGGIGGNKKATRHIACLDTAAKKWLFDKIPEMPTARNSPCAVCTPFHLVVAGGFDDTRFRVDVVEVYDSHAKQWFQSCPLPRACSDLKGALIDGDLWYLAGGANEGKSVFYASLRSIIEHVVSSQATPLKKKASPAARPVWMLIRDALFEFGSIAFFGNCLLAIGGEKVKRQVSVYVPHKNAWLAVSDLPVGVSRAATIVLDSGELLVVGGRSSRGPQTALVQKCVLK